MLICCIRETALNSHLYLLVLVSDLALVQVSQHRASFS